MKIHFKLTVILLFTIYCQFFAQINKLKAKMEGIIASKHAVVGIAVKDSNPKDTLSINGNRQFPLQSVFKLHIALAVLSKIDQGKFSLNQKIKIDKKDLLSDLYSPIRDRYPNGTTLPLSKILEYTVSQSDNVCCEILLRMLWPAGC
ncbi:serine hydrolase [uncultured Chryseobacterium sp.]|uniref:serine hydrolase n=1 Tax=uncultured Chryseobacterium sp. TaxID=259322 RepID=UPI0025E6E8FE|nr:serine hydrolase [uncultured Chryseobacterium sp.]